MKVQVGTFNEEKVPVGAFSVIVKSSLGIVASSNNDIINTDKNGSEWEVNSNCRTFYGLQSII